MAFSAAGLNCIAVGPNKVYTYTTSDTLTSATVKTDFNTTNCPGMAAGDIVFICNKGNTTLSAVMITAIDSSSSTITLETSLA